MDLMLQCPCSFAPLLYAIVKPRPVIYISALKNSRRNVYSQPPFMCSASLSLLDSRASSSILSTPRSWRAFCKT